MIPRMYLVEISIFSLNDVTIRPAKIINRANKNWAHLEEIKYFENQKFQDHFFIKSWSLSSIFFKDFFLERFDPFSTLENDFEI